MGQVADARGTARQGGLRDRLHAVVAGRAAVGARLAAQPEPRLIGQPERGRRLIAGQFDHAGDILAAPGRSVWDAVPGPGAHACAWIDDLAALGDGPARDLARGWVADWIARFGRGRGPGWTAELTAARMLRWIGHAAFLRRGADAAAVAAMDRSLGQQALFLSRRWPAAPPGLPRIGALSALTLAGLTLDGGRIEGPAMAAALGRACDDTVDPTGAIPTRSPEDLARVLLLLTWVAEALTAAGSPVPAGIAAAIARAAPTLRALRHADGGLARFHGGGRGTPGQVDAALAAAGTRDRREGVAMGYARLTAGRTTVIMDVAPPAAGHPGAHAATLAFELTSGRRPLVANCGPGAEFGPGWAQACRATPSQSTLGLDGFSSSRTGPAGTGAFAERPDRVPCNLGATVAALRAGAAHNGWQRTHGLTHARTLELTLDGRALAGEDLLVALSDTDKAAFDRRLAAAGQGPGWSLRFHLHPDVTAQPDLTTGAILLALKSGELWILRAEGPQPPRIEASVWMETGLPRPRPSLQVVLSGRAMSYATRVRWTIAKAQETPNALRDLAPDGDQGDGAG